MLHPHTTLALVDEEVGYGIFATERIPAGTITWTLDPLDRRIPPAELETLSPTLWEVLRRYAYFDGSGDYILCWDFARYMNHSCAPNVLAPGIDVEVAVRDILPGEQLTGDYGAYNLEMDLLCLCGTDACRGTIRSGDFDVFAATWDAALRRAVRMVSTVPQPLWEHVTDKDLLSAAAQDPELLPTCLDHRMPEPLARSMH